MSAASDQTPKPPPEVLRPQAVPPQILPNVAPLAAVALGAGGAAVAWADGRKAQAGGPDELAELLGGAPALVCHAPFL
ncbi:MAG: hypothetical protein AAGL49_04805, partial [Pseudomonadota bacterium]